MEYFLKAVRDNYANFDGRARRQEYWMFILFFLIGYFALAIVAGALSSIINSALPMILPFGYAIALIVPAYAALARRMHDVGKSGWYMLIPIYSLILACTEGEIGPNIYGEDPKALESNF